jgi:hypothetical protein
LTSESITSACDAVSGNRWFNSVHTELQRPKRPAPARHRTGPRHSAILTSTMSIDLTQLSEAELLDLHRRITERLQFINAARRLTQLASFSTGMTVEFSADDGRVIRGTIARLNRRTATVVTTASGSWRVSPSLLRVVDETAAPAASPRVLPMQAHRHRS